MWATITIAESFTRIMVRQLVMCTVPSSDRRRRFLQYNFMDPGSGEGGRTSYGAPGFLGPPLAPALVLPPPNRCLWAIERYEI